MNRYLKKIIVLSLAFIPIVCHASDSDDVKSIIMGGIIKSPLMNINMLSACLFHLFIQVKYNILLYLT